MPPIDRDDANRPSGTLALVQGTVDLKMPGHIIVRIQPVEESTIIGGSSTRLPAGSQDQGRLAVILHGVQGASRNQVVNLPDLVAVHVHLGRLAVLSLDRAERRVGHYRIDRFRRYIGLQSIAFANIESLSLQGFSAIRLKFVGNRILGFGPNQQHAVSGSRLVNFGVLVHSGQPVGKKGQRCWGRVRLILNARAGANIEVRLLTVQVYQLIEGSPRIAAFRHKIAGPAHHGKLEFFLSLFQSGIVGRLTVEVRNHLAQRVVVARHLAFADLIVEMIGER